jgi:hypothetical protein
MVFHFRSTHELHAQRRSHSQALGFGFRRRKAGGIRDRRLRCRQ